MDAKQTGALVARRRRARGLSQAELAEELHISDKTVSKWETGRGMPGIDLLEALGEALQLSVSELVRGTELTPEELPKAAGEELVTSMKRGGKMLWRGVITA
ncbi:MAG: helix-turn-helix transcriptional regulator, partial [Oscillibacter sp.]